MALEKIFKVFPMISQWELKTKGAWPICSPGVWLVGFMQGTTY